jgi:hypothetical protein
MRKISPIYCNSVTRKRNGFGGQRGFLRPLTGLATCEPLHSNVCLALATTHGELTVMNLDSLRKRCLQGETFQYLLFWGHQPSTDGTVSKSCLSKRSGKAFMDFIRFSEHNSSLTEIIFYKLVSRSQYIRIKRKITIPQSVVCNDLLMLKHL